MASERDYAFEALAEVTNTAMNVGRGELNAALRDIRAQEEELAALDMSFELSVLIHERAKQYRAAWPSMTLTPNALSKHWSRIEAEAPKPHYVQPTTTVCSTCNGDKVVLVSQRKPQQSMWMREQKIEMPEMLDSKFPLETMEEYAACPDCNSRANTEHFRSDGTKVRPPDPARVREMMGK